MHKTSDYDYQLQEDLIAQSPLLNRDGSRLLVLDRGKKHLDHVRFQDLPSFLDAGDILVANDSRVIPGRMYGQKEITGGKVEMLLLEHDRDEKWRVLIGGRRVSPGLVIRILDRAGQKTDISAEVLDDLGGALREVVFSEPIIERLDQIGHVPLPPYIKRQLKQPDRYQTLYARQLGSAAAPTAGLHFSADLLHQIREKGVLFETTTLHVGLDTFKPVEVEKIAEHKIHSEWASLSPDAARRINRAKLAGGRIVAVGTTSARVLETAALRSAGIMGSLANMSEKDASGEATAICPWRPVAAFEGHTDLYIYPGYRFRATDALITNFHLPRSSLLMLVTAFANRERILDTYQIAQNKGYRFYSFGDAMLIS